MTAFLLVVGSEKKLNLLFLSFSKLAGGIFFREPKSKISPAYNEINFFYLNNNTFSAYRTSCMYDKPHVNAQLMKTMVATG